jgi:phosphoesterase RecJ-like protein
MDQNLEKFFNILESFENFILITHLNPDVDGISSMLTLHNLLKLLNKNSFPLLENIPENIEFLPYSEDLILIDNFKNLPQKFATIILDAHSPERIFEKIYERILNSEVFIIIDHHQIEKNKKSFSEDEITIIDPSAPSTTFLIYKILKNKNFIITPEMAQNLLAGLYFDTGCFKYENVDEKTFLIASELCKLGAKPHLIASHLFENISLKELETLKVILNRLEFLENGIIAISYLTYEDIQNLGIKNLNDFSNFLRSIKGVKISVLIKEVEKNIVSVSLRSRAPVEVLNLAKTFGGGGHKYACGFKMKIENFYEFLKKFKEILKNYYGS